MVSDTFLTNSIIRHGILTFLHTNVRPQLSCVNTLSFVPEKSRISVIKATLRVERLSSSCLIHLRRAVGARGRRDLSNWLRPAATRRDRAAVSGLQAAPFDGCSRRWSNGPTAIRTAVGATAIEMANAIRVRKQEEPNSPIYSTTRSQQTSAGILETTLPNHGQRVKNQNWGKATLILFESLE